MKKLKYIIALVLALSVILVVVTWRYVVNDIEDYSKTTYKIEEIRTFKRLNNTETRIQNGVANNKKNTHFIAELIEKELSSSGIDEEKLSTLFILFANNYDQYSQIRFIDSSGREVVRVNSGKTVALVPEDRLQNKAKRYYFKEAKKRKPGEIYISPLDLNVENGVVERPYNPTIRFFTPIYVNNTFYGTVGLNFKAKKWLDQIYTSEVLLLNTKGERFNGDSVGCYKKDAEINKITDETSRSRTVAFDGTIRWKLIANYDMPWIAHRIDVFKKASYNFLLVIVLLVVAVAGYSIRRLYTYNVQLVENQKLNLHLSEANVKLKQLVGENTILTKELHHRTKNNLQVISSILNLKRNDVKTKESKELIGYIQHRVQAIADIHTMLYKSHLQSEVPFKEYLNKLVPELIETLNVENKAIKVEFDIKKLLIPIERAIPLGLLITEIITNSMKYAFNTSKGNLYITVDKTNGHYLLLIGDDGIGIGAFKPSENSTSLGMTLIAALVEQIEGTLELDETKQGTNYIIEFRF